MTDVVQKGAEVTETIAYIYFARGDREVRVEIPSIRNISPRKIEYASKMLIREFKKKNAEVYHAEAQKARDMEKAELEARRKAEEDAEVRRQAEHKRHEEALEQTEYERLRKKYDPAKPAGAKIVTKPKMENVNAG